ncbi:uncharacterized protein [Malus domestica]|uniref:uncharacterized protein isoform X9 n=1 Tax=Malus domestica TaxID=3750 RepID=UPI0039753DE2
MLICLRRCLRNKVCRRLLIYLCCHQNNEKEPKGEEEKKGKQERELCTCKLMFDVLLQVLLGDVGAGKSSLVLCFVKGQFVEFQQSVGIPDIDSGSTPKQGRLTAIHKNCSAAT